MSFTHALKWSFFSELAAKAIQPVIFIVLARLLTPEDFGVMTGAMMVIAFSQIFWEAGMGKALIQRQTHIEEAANAAFMINIGLGVLIAGMLYMFAPSIAQFFFQDSRVTAVLQVMTLQVLLGALGSVQTALLQKEMGFKKLFWVRFATVSLPGLASIPLAMNGWGYWALVVGTLSGQFAQVLMLWRMSHWRPGFTRDRVVTKEMARFGGWVGATGVLAWLYIWADSFVVGHYLGSHALGLYRMGCQATLLFFSFISAGLMPVFYSWLVDKDKEETVYALKCMVAILAIVFLPFSYVVFMNAGILSDLIFGEKWKGIATVIALMSVANGLSFLLIANGEVYRAMGRPEFETYPMFLGLFVFVPTYLYSINYGLESFIIGRVLAVILFGFALHAILANKIVGLKIRYYINYLILYGVVVCISLLAAQDLSLLNRAVFSVFIAIFLLVTIFISNKDLYVEIWNRKLKARFFLIN